MDFIHNFFADATLGSLAIIGIILVVIGVVEYVVRKKP